MPDLPDEMENQLNIYIEEDTETDSSTPTYEAVAFIKPVMGTVEGFSMTSPEHARRQLLETLEALCVDLGHVEIRTFWPNDPETRRDA